MRIENNNNLAFGAYFKKNAMFKELFAKTPKTEKFVDEANLFADKLPNHEIELLSIDYEDPLYSCKVFNNTTKKMTKLSLTEETKNLFNLERVCGDLMTIFVFGRGKKHSFFEVDKTITDTFEKLTKHDR